MTGNRRIRVLLVDDSPVVLEILRRILSADAGFEVIGTARDGREGVEQAIALAPDVVCTDLLMPVVDGLGLIERLMREQPMPILVVSDVVHATDSANVFDLLAAGAVDVFPKPRGGFNVTSAAAEDLRRRVRLVAGVHVFRRRGGGTTDASTAVATPPHLPATSSVDGHGVVVIGASTGGPRGLARILSALPRDYSLPVLIAQHISPGFEQSLLDWLNGIGVLTVETATAGTRPRPGHAYLAPEGCHLLVDSGGRLACPPDDGALYVPSVDRLFASAGRAHGSEVVAVLLSGMGVDGARAMRDLYDRGALTIVQDEETSVVFGMPGEAIRLGGAREILPIEAIGPYLAAVGAATRGASDEEALA